MSDRLTGKLRAKEKLPCRCIPQLAANPQAVIYYFVYIQQPPCRVCFLQSAKYKTVLELTGNVERGVAADGLPQVVARDAGVDALVRFASASVHDAEEKERAAGQEHAVGAGVVPVRLHTLAILVPLYGGGGPALRLAVQGGRLPLGHDQVRRVLRNPRRAVFKPCPRPWRRGHALQNVFNCSVFKVKHLLFPATTTLSDARGRFALRAAARTCTSTGCVIPCDTICVNQGCLRVWADCWRRAEAESPGRHVHLGGLRETEQRHSPLPGGPSLPQLGCEAKTPLQVKR